MSRAFLCVQFRNLLPSEQLVLLARALWSDLQAAGVWMGTGDAVLALTQIAGDTPSYEAELTLPGVPRLGVARAHEARVAVEEAFALWRSERAAPVGRVDGVGTDESATVGLSG